MPKPTRADGRLACLAGHIVVADTPTGRGSHAPPLSAVAVSRQSVVLFIEDHMEGIMPQKDVLEAFGIHDFHASWDVNGQPEESVAALVTVKKKVDDAMLDKFPSLRLVAVSFTGFDHVDLEACRRRGVAVANVPGYATDGVGELCFGLIFSLLRHIPLANQHIRDGKWAWKPGNELSGKSFGLIGTGQIGMRVGEIAKAFNVKKIWGWDKFKNPRFTEELGGEYVSSLASLFLHTDIVVVCVALTKETTGLVSAKLLKLLRPDSILINCARGAIIDQAAMVTMLQEGRFRAGLDVYESEPLAPDHPIRSIPESNLVTLPHLAYKCEESLFRRHDVTLANILAFFADSPQNIVS